MICFFDDPDGDLNYLDNNFIYVKERKVMARKTMKRYLTICLIVVMLLTTLLPVGAFAVDDAVVDDTTADYEVTAASDTEAEPAAADDAGDAVGDVHDHYFNTISKRQYAVAPPVRWSQISCSTMHRVRTRTRHTLWKWICPIRV